MIIKIYWPNAIVVIKDFFLSKLNSKSKQVSITPICSVRFIIASHGGANIFKAIYWDCKKRPKICKSHILLDSGTRALRWDSFKPFTCLSRNIFQSIKMLDGLYVRSLTQGISWHHQAAAVNPGGTDRIFFGYFF